MEDFNKARLQVDCGGGHSSNHDQGLAQETGEGCIDMNSTVDRRASNTLIKLRSYMGSPMLWSTRLCRSGRPCGGKKAVDAVVGIQGTGRWGGHSQELKESMSKSRCQKVGTRDFVMSWAAQPPRGWGKKPNEVRIVGDSKMGERTMIVIACQFSPDRLQQSNFGLRFGALAISLHT